ncbi:hypothetical protein [Microbispora sp. H10836]|uniref:hypothetical protein n=1 Tax=Microbispora sp. H10836 TaxID=2729106 RepID=UPI00147338EA|nr:hypothetical protein [Microbispora sp. H10836]
MTDVLTFFTLPTEAGHDLLDNWVEPICRKYGLRLRLAPARANRATALVAQRTSAFVLWDGSVEGPEDVYRAFSMHAKLRAHNLLVSRTPLPRNVLTRNQRAPVHGATMDNAVLAEWLDRHLHTHLRGVRAPRRPPSRSAHYWMFENPADYFLSFRGSHQEAAERWRAAFEEEHGVRVRMVPACEYSYPTEVVTRQQMWEGAARLMYEITATGRVLVHLSPDYFDSFWTASELLATLWLLPRGSTPPTIRSAHVLDGRGTLVAFGYRGAGRALDVPHLTAALADRFAKLINNTDPVTTAPETRVPPRGPARVLARLVRSLGYYDPEFTACGFWEDVRVPCPACKPRGRAADEVDWGRHMARADEDPSVDYYGYFTAHRGHLARGRIRCPGCGGELTLVNDRGVRTLWVPVMTTEKDQDRPVIQSHPVWEVVTG